jgi:23S rRNA (uridine2552-2'-O)-methyltransferase
MADEEEPPRRRIVRSPTRGDAAGRGMGSRLKTADERTLSSQQWLRRQLNDPFVVRAKAEGWRSRAAFKLTEIDDRFHLIRRGARVLDLGCAPGGWVQVAMKRGAARVVGVDLLPLAPVPGAELIEGDFTEPGMEARLIEALGAAPDLVLSDMAPNTVGHRPTDHLRIAALIEPAAAFAARTLKPGGAFVTKAFQGGELAEVIQALKADYDTVKQVKPKASRAESSEVYLLALGRRG